MPFQIKTKIEGLGPLVERLNKLKRNVRNKVLRYAVRNGANIYNKAAKAAARLPATSATAQERGVQGRDKSGRFLSIAERKALGQNVRQGLISKSIGVKITIKRDGAAVAVVGPRTGFKTQVGVTTRAGKSGPPGTPIYEDPAKIAHLVEFGHGGPHPAPRHPFMRPAWDSTKRQVEQTMAATIAAGLVED